MVCYQDINSLPDIPTNGCILLRYGSESFSNTEGVKREVPSRFFKKKERKENRSMIVCLDGQRGKSKHTLFITLTSQESIYSMTGDFYLDGSCKY